MEEHSSKRNESNEDLFFDKKNDLQAMSDIRKQQYEKAMDRLEHFQQQAAPDYYTAYYGTDKLIFGHDQYGEVTVSRESMDPDEKKEMDVVLDTLRDYRGLKNELEQDENGLDSTLEEQNAIDGDGIAVSDEPYETMNIIGFVNLHEGINRDDSDSREKQFDRDR